MADIRTGRQTGRWAGGRNAGECRAFICQCRSVCNKFEAISNDTGGEGSDDSTGCAKWLVAQAKYMRSAQQSELCRAQRATTERESGKWAERGRERGRLQTESARSYRLSTCCTISHLARFMRVLCAIPAHVPAHSSTQRDNVKCKCNETKLRPLTNCTCPAIFQFQFHLT